MQVMYTRVYIKMFTHMHDALSQHTMTDLRLSLLRYKIKSGIL